MAKKTGARRPTSVRGLQEAIQRKDLELELAEKTYAERMLARLEAQEARFASDDDLGWLPVSVGGGIVAAKDLQETKRLDPTEVRRLSYRFWKTNPFARGILRTFEKFIVGKEFGLDFADTTRGTWDPERKKLLVTTGEDDPLLMRELWNDFAEMNAFPALLREFVRRTFRDGGAFLRKFGRHGFVQLRFIEPEWVEAPQGKATGTVDPDDMTPELLRIYGPEQVGKPTLIVQGFEVLKEDPVTVIAYWITRPGAEPERVPAKDIIHTKPLADANDLTGQYLLEVIFRHLTYYAQWEEYRLVLNKFRSAVVLVRKIEGTASQAAAIVAGRASPRRSPTGVDPVTTSGRREAMPAPGTILSAPMGVDYDWKRPNLDASDAEHDGRRFQLSMAAGVGLPEMMVTGDWSNANYSSSVESRTPAVREWEDWQEFFEVPIRRIVRWVREEAIQHLGLPEESLPGVTIQWPSLVTKDAEKETNRNVKLREQGIMSPQTFAAKEGLVWDEELENMQQAAEQLGQMGMTAAGALLPDPASDGTMPPGDASAPTTTGG